MSTDQPRRHRLIIPPNGTGLAPLVRGTARALLPGLLLLAAAADGAAQEAKGAGATPPDSTAPERKVRVSGYPYVFSTPEAGPAVGLGGIVTFYTSRTDSLLRPSKVSAGGWYSLNDQYKITLTPVAYLEGNRWQISLPADYGRFTDRFWGIGNETDEFLEDTTPGAPSAPYRMSAANLKLDVQFPPGTSFSARLFTRVGIVLELNDTRILDPLDNPLIDSTLEGHQGGQTIGAGVVFVRDDRNQTFFPSGGGLYTTKLVLYPPILVADYSYTRVEVDLRKYLGRNPNEVLALQAYGSFMFGNPPFYALSALGGPSRMRGYFMGRYRDRHYLTTQAEYRKMFWWRLGFVAFAGTGEVFGSEGSGFRLSSLQWSVGGGLRVLFNKAERVNLRIDLGIGKHTTGLYFQLEEAF
jgi:outer membrane protein assembly factor BamA